MYKLFVLLFISTHKADRLILEVTVFLHCSVVMCVMLKSATSFVSCTRVDAELLFCVILKNVL